MNVVAGNGGKLSNLNCKLYAKCVNLATSDFFFKCSFWKDDARGRPEQLTFDIQAASVFVPALESHPLPKQAQELVEAFAAAL